MNYQREYQQMELQSITVGKDLKKKFTKTLNMTHAVDCQPLIFLQLTCKYIPHLLIRQTGCISFKLVKATDVTLDWVFL